MSTKIVANIAAKFLTALSRGEVALEALDSVKDEEAERRRRIIRAKFDEATSQVQLATAHVARSKQLKVSVGARTVSLEAATTGTYAIIEAVSPETALRLPDQRLWSEAAPHEHAAHLIVCLREIGSPLAMSCADNLEAVDNRREREVRELTEMESDSTVITRADNAVARLNLAVAEADMYLRDLARPGSALAALLDKMHGKGKTRSRSGSKSKPTSKATAPASGTGSNAGAPSHSPATESPASSPTPRQPPTVPVAPTAPSPAPQVIAQPPVAVPPAGNRAGGAAVMNGSASAQLNGAAH